MQYSINLQCLLLIVQLLDEKCGCEEGCFYSPGHFIEFTKEATVITLLQEAYSDVSFFQRITPSIIDASKIIDTIPPLYSGYDGNIDNSTVPEPDGELD